MRKIETIMIILCIAFNANAQTLVGVFYNIKSNKQIDLKLTSDEPTVSIVSSNTVNFYKVDKEGRFYIPLDDLKKFSDYVSLSIIMFYSDNYNFADYVIKNIPKDSLELLIKKVYLTPAYWKASCGRDCFTINNRKTFCKKEIIVNNGFYYYKIKRIPKRIKQSMLAVYYETDFEKDLIQ